MFFQRAYLISSVVFLQVNVFLYIFVVENKTKILSKIFFCSAQSLTSCLHWHNYSLRHSLFFAVNHRLSNSVYENRQMSVFIKWCIVFLNKNVIFKDVIQSYNICFGIACAFEKESTCAFVSCAVNRLTH